MAKLLKTFIRKTFLANKKNLVSLDEPYQVMERLLRGREVTGVIDAGASNGRISRRLLTMFPKATAYAFEPNPLYAEILQQYALQNPRFRPQFLALSEREGTASLRITESPGSTSLFDPGKRLDEMDPQGSKVKNMENEEFLNNYKELSKKIQDKISELDSEREKLYGAEKKPFLEANTLIELKNVITNFLKKEMSHEAKLELLKSIFDS